MTLSAAKVTIRAWRAHGSMPLLMASLLVSPLALASDFSGVVSMMFGVPALLVLDLILGLMLIVEPSRLLRIWASLLGYPTLMIGFLLWGDAASLFRTEPGVPWGVAYFLLYASGVALLVRHFTRREAAAARDGGAGN